MTYALPSGIDSRPVCVLGAGTLGRRVALMLATQGAEVRLYDPDATVREEGAGFATDQLPGVLRKRGESGRAGSIVPAADLAAALKTAWLAIEAVPEKLELKRSVFRQLDELAEPDAILATNSSSYASSELIDSVRRPERLLNMHFLMPPLQTAVELMSCGKTDPAVIDLLKDRLPGYGLTPYVVERESMGFIYNRIWAAVKREALSVVAEGVAGPDVVDAIYAQSTGMRYGPCRMMDFVGLDVVLSIEENYAERHPELPEAPRSLLRTMIAEGKLGMKNGRGFYDYPSATGA